MPNLRLRLRNGNLLEPLPGRCLFCGKKVLQLRLRVLTLAGRQVRLQLPLCDENRKAGTFDLDHPQGTPGRVLEAVSWHGGLAVGVFWHLFQLFNWLTTPRQERGDQFLVIRGVCPRFLDALEDLRERTKGVEDEGEAEDEPAAGGRTKPRRDPYLPWILAGVGTVLVMGLFCGGIITVAAVRKAQEREQQRAQAPAAPGGFEAPAPPPPPPFVPGGNGGPGGAADAGPAPGEILPPFEGHTGNVIALAFSPQGDTLISAGEDGMVRWWRDGAPGQPPTQLQAGPGKPYGMALAPDGRLLAVTCWEGTVQLFDGAGQRPPETLAPRTGFVSLGLAFAPDGRTLLTGHYDGNVMEWDVEARQLRGKLKADLDWVMAIAFSPDGKLFATAGSPSRAHLVAAGPAPEPGITLWDAPSQQPAGRLTWAAGPGGGSVRYLAFSPDGQALASAADDGTARLWDVAGRRERVSLVHPEKQVNGVAFTPDGALVLTGCKDGRVRLWDTGTDRPRADIDTHPLPYGPGVTAVAVSPDGKTVAAGCGRTIRRWDLAQVLAGRPGR